MVAEIAKRPKEGAFETVAHQTSGMGGGPERSQA